MKTNRENLYGVLDKHGREFEVVRAVWDGVPASHKRLLPAGYEFNMDRLLAIEEAARAAYPWVGVNGMRGNWMPPKIRADLRAALGET